MIVEDDNGEGGVEDCDVEDLSEIELICTDWDHSWNSFVWRLRKSLLIQSSNSYFEFCLLFDKSNKNLADNKLFSIPFWNSLQIEAGSKIYDTQM